MSLPSQDKEIWYDNGPRGYALSSEDEEEEEDEEEGMGDHEEDGGGQEGRRRRRGGGRWKVGSKLGRDHDLDYSPRYKTPHLTNRGHKLSAGSQFIRKGRLGGWENHELFESRSLFPSNLHFPGAGGAGNPHPAAPTAGPAGAAGGAPSTSSSSNAPAGTIPTTAATHGSANAASNIKALLKPLADSRLPHAYPITPNLTLVPSSSTAAARHDKAHFSRTKQHVPEVDPNDPLSSTSNGSRKRQKRHHQTGYSTLASTTSSSASYTTAPVRAYLPKPPTDPIELIASPIISRTFSRNNNFLEKLSLSTTELIEQDLPYLRNLVRLNDFLRGNAIAGFGLDVEGGVSSSTRQSGAAAEEGGSGGVEGTDGSSTGVNKGKQREAKKGAGAEGGPIGLPFHGFDERLIRPDEDDQPPSTKQERGSAAVPEDGGAATDTTVGQGKEGGATENGVDRQLDEPSKNETTTINGQATAPAPSDDAPAPTAKDSAMEVDPVTSADKQKEVSQPGIGETRKPAANGITEDQKEGGTTVNASQTPVVTVSDTANSEAEGHTDQTAAESSTDSKHGAGKDAGAEDKRESNGDSGEMQVDGKDVAGTSAAPSKEVSDPTPTGPEPEEVKDEPSPPRTRGAAAAAAAQTGNTTTNGATPSQRRSRSASTSSATSSTAAGAATAKPGGPTLPKFTKVAEVIQRIANPQPYVESMFVSDRDIVVPLSAKASSEGTMPYLPGGESLLAKTRSSISRDVQQQALNPLGYDPSTHVRLSPEEQQKTVQLCLNEITRCLADSLEYQDRLQEIRDSILGIERRRRGVWAMARGCEYRGKEKGVCVRRDYGLPVHPAGSTGCDGPALALQPRLLTLLSLVLLSRSPTAGIPHFHRRASDAMGRRTGQNGSKWNAPRLKTPGDCTEQRVARLLLTEGETKTHREDGPREAFLPKSTRAVCSVSVLDLALSICVQEGTCQNGVSEALCLPSGMLYSKGSSIGTTARQRCSTSVYQSRASPRSAVRRAHRANALPRSLRPSAVPLEGHR